MKKIGAIGLASLLLAQALAAQPAVYRDEVLSIPTAAAIGENGEARYYGEVALRDEGGGLFRLVQADAKPLVQVEEVEVLILESFPVQVSVHVEGFKSVPCVELLPPAVSREENTFTVVLAESELGPAESCIAVVDPFETRVSLPVRGLEAGEYTVSVNGVEADFTLEVDNF